MAEQPDEETIQRLLTELQSTDAYRRQAAIESFANLKTNNEQIVNVLRDMTTSDPSQFVRQAAGEALIALGIETPVAPTPPTRVTIKDLYQNRDFRIGFIGWIVVNVPVSFFWFMSQVGRSLTHQDPGYVIAFLPFVINIGVLLLLAFTRRYIAFGILVAIGLSLIASILLYPFVLGQCFIFYLFPFVSTP